MCAYTPLSSVTSSHVLTQCIDWAVFLLDCLLGIVTATTGEGIRPHVIEIVCLVGDLVADVLRLVAPLSTGVIVALGLHIIDLVEIIHKFNVKSIIDILSL